MVLSRKKIKTQAEVGAVTPEALRTIIAEGRKISRKRKKEKLVNTDASNTQSDPANKKKKPKKKKQKQVQLPTTEAENSALADQPNVNLEENEVSASEEGRGNATKRAQDEDAGGLVSKRSKKKKKKGDSHTAEENENLEDERAGVEHPGAVINGDQAGEKENVLKKKGKKKKKKKLDKWGQVIQDVEDTDEQDIENSVHQSHADGIEYQTNNVIEQYEPKKVYVGGFPYYTTEDDIHNYFAECGTITELDCMTFPDTGKFRGIAFITFKTEVAATKALDLDGADMDGRFLKIAKCKAKALQKPRNEEHHEPPPKTEGCTSAYIGNLAWDITVTDIKTFFKDCKVSGVRLALDKTSGEFRGYGHIDFQDDESLEKAIKLNQQELLGRPIKIAYALPKKSIASIEAETNDAEIRRNKKTCHHCGEQGHYAVHCPKKTVKGVQT